MRLKWEPPLERPAFMASAQPVVPVVSTRGAASFISSPPTGVGFAGRRMACVRGWWLQTDRPVVSVIIRTVLCESSLYPQPVGLRGLLFVPIFERLPLLGRGSVHESLSSICMNG